MKETELKFNPFMSWAANRIRHNKNCLIVVNGSTGSGKSYSCLSLAKQLAAKLGTHFTIQDNLAFKFTDLLEKGKLPENQKPGTCYVFEEVGAFGGGASSREWQTKSNKFFFSFMQTSRHRNQILFLNCPNFAFLEKGARSLVHMQLECVGIDRERRMVQVKPYRVQVNSRNGKFYFKYLRVHWKGGKVRFSSMDVPHPGEDITSEYEKVKTEYTTCLNETIIRKEHRKEVAEENKEQTEQAKYEVNKDDRLLTLKEAREIVHVTRETLVDNLKKGIFRGKKIGSKWFISENSLKTLTY